MKRIINISLTIACSVGLLLLLGFVNVNQHSVMLKGFNIKIAHKNNNFFVLENDISAILAEQGCRVGVQPMGEVNIKQIEHVLNNNGSIKTADVSYTVDGMVNIEIEQREPVARVINSDGLSYYLDLDGGIMPLSNKYTSKLMVINGAVNYPHVKLYKHKLHEAIEVENVDQAEVEKMTNLFNLASFIYDNEFWKSQILQAFVRENGDIELIPRVGNHVINFGSGDRVEQKFAKLKIFYDKGLSKSGWNEYSEVNLKYENQVVCTKK